VCSRVDDSKHHFGFADDFAVDETTPAGFDDGFFSLGHFDFNEERIARDNGFTEFDGIGAHKVANFSRVTWEAEEKDAPDLSHGFDLEDAWHDGMTGEVAWKVPFVHGDGFHADAFGFAFDGDDTIDHEEGIAVGEKFHDIIDVEDIAAFWGDTWGEEGEGFGELFRDESGEVGVGAVAWFDGDDMTADGATEEGEIADDIENFVANEFVLEAKGFFAEDRVTANDHGVFEASAFD